MNPLDKVLAKSIRDIIKEMMDSKTFKKIEDKLFEMFGLSMTDAIEDFPKIDLVLRKFFGTQTIKIESQIFKKIISIEKNAKDPLININDQSVSNRILESYGDPVKKTILELLLRQSKSIPEIVNEIKLPQASTYRKVKDLIDDGFITIIGYTKANDGRKTNEYATTFNRVIFDFRDNGHFVSVKMQSKFLRDSFVFSSI